MIKILIVEDDVVIRNELIQILRKHQYEVEAIMNFENVLEDIVSISPHLILLDINLPQNDGYYLCRKLRETSQIPIIITTSRDTDLDELMGINLGADDFVKKPYNIHILLARIERLIKRYYQFNTEDVLTYDNIRLDLVRGTLHYGDNSEILSRNELAIVKYFFQHNQKLVTREELMLYLWNSSAFIDDNTLSVNITRIRKKFVLLGIGNRIETRRGLGYLFQ